MGTGDGEILFFFLCNEPFQNGAVQFLAGRHFEKVHCLSLHCICRSLKISKSFNSTSIISKFFNPALKEQDPGPNLKRSFNPALKEQDPGPNLKRSFNPALLYYYLYYYYNYFIMFFNYVYYKMPENCVNYLKIPSLLSP